MLVWKPEYSIGVQLIDEQHKYLFEIIDSVFELSKCDFRVGKYDRIALIIQDLCQYAKFHFVTEEEYMIRINYKGYSSHKADHNDFTEYINKINLEKVEEDPQKYITDILSFLLNWLLDHILMKDKLIKIE
ncbi:MAG: hemerythrin family protein [Desulfosporosinus sp.]|nr:hemerythrin family protein [Desulfosporosinus sp.]